MKTLGKIIKNKEAVDKELIQEKLRKSPFSQPWQKLSDQANGENKYAIYDYQWTTPPAKSDLTAEENLVIIDKIKLKKKKKNKRKNVSIFPTKTATENTNVISDIVTELVDAPAEESATLSASIVEDSKKAVEIIEEKEVISTSEKEQSAVIKKAKETKPAPTAKEKKSTKIEKTKSEKAKTEKEKSAKVKAQKVTVPKAKTEKTKAEKAKTTKVTDKVKSKKKSTKKVSVSQPKTSKTKSKATKKKTKDMGLDPFTVWINSLDEDKKSKKSKSSATKSKAEKKTKKAGKKSAKSKLKSKISKSVKTNKKIATEALAQLYTEQGHYKKAIKVYETLSLKNPKKSSFFAVQIKDLKKKL